MQTFYTLPFSPGKLLEGKRLERTDLKSSIAGYLHLILITHQGEHRFDEQFGNEIWEEDFKVIGNVDQWKDQVTRKLKKLIQSKEKRLSKIKIKSKISQVEFVKQVDRDYAGKPPRRIRKQLDISVEGKLVATNEIIHFEDRIYLSPISFD